MVNNRKRPTIALVYFGSFVYLLVYLHLDEYWHRVKRLFTQKFRKINRTMLRKSCPWGPKGRDSQDFMTPFKHVRSFSLKPRVMRQTSSSGDLPDTNVVILTERMVPLKKMSKILYGYQNDAAERIDSISFCPFYSSMNINISLANSFFKLNDP